MSEEKTINVYRYKLEPAIIDLINDFAKLHQYDSRKDYKEAWDIWYNETEDIKREEKRLVDIGYVGDINIKMYKAGRYYYRKKELNPNKEAKKRNTYITLNNEVLELMDNHIKENIDNDDYSPANGFNNFCEIYSDIVLKEIKRLFTNYNFTDEDIKYKIKKTYKNRYYLISRN